MITPLAYPTAICAYNKCGKTFIKDNPKKIHCSDSCRVRKCTSRKKENTPLTGAASVQKPVLPSQASLSDFISEIKALSTQIGEVKTRTTDDITFTGVLEALIANFTAKFLQHLLMGDPLNDKLDYIIRQIQQLNAKHNQVQVPTVGGMMTAAAPLKIGIKTKKDSASNIPMGMAMPWPKDMLM